MENPAREIKDVITTLTTGSSPEQEATLKTYFTSDAAFYHPFCRVPSFPAGAVPFARDLESRWLLLCIYRWYRTLSPHIDISINHAVFDPPSNKLYVSIRQTFSIWFIPLHHAPVDLVTVLQLVRLSTLEHSASTTALLANGADTTRYYISSQDDRYQLTDCIRLVVPWVLPLLWALWQLFSTGVCVVGSLVFLPLYFVMNRGIESKAKIVS